MTMSTSPKFKDFSVGTRGVNRVRVYTDQNGYILAEWREPCPDGPARKRRMKLECRTRDDAKEKAQEIAALLLSRRVATQRGEAPESEGGPESLTVGQLFDIYGSKVTPKKSQKSQQFDRSCLAMWAKFLGRDTPAMEVGRREWYAFREARESERIFPGERSRGKPSPRTVRRDMTLLRAVYNWATDPQDGLPVLIPHNPFEGLGLPNERKPNRVQVSAKKVDMLLRAAPAVDWRLWVALVLGHETGHRISSIRRLRWDDIHLVTEEIEWQWERDKENNPHRTPMTPDARAALEEARARVDQDVPWVLPAPKNPQQPCRKDTLTNLLKKAEKRAGLPRVKGFGFHSLRRKLVNDLRDQISVTQLAALGGWTNPDTVVRVYMDSDPDKLREVQALRPGLGIASEPRKHHAREGGLSGHGAGTRGDSKADSKRMREA